MIKLSYKEFIRLAKKHRFAFRKGTIYGGEPVGNCPKGLMSMEYGYEYSCLYPKIDKVTYVNLDQIERGFEGWPGAGRYYDIGVKLKEFANAH